MPQMVSETVVLVLLEPDGEIHMSDSKKYSIGVSDVLAIVFIVLKLIGVINWSRVWVLSPIWISLIVICDN